MQFGDINGNVYAGNWIGMVNWVEGTKKWLHLGGIQDIGGDGQRRLGLWADRVYVSGNLGVGTLTPKAKLNVTTGTTGVIPTLGVSSGNLFLGGDNNLYGLYSGSVSADGNSWLQVMRNDSAIAYNLLLQPAGGKVGIGTSAPKTKLQIQENGNSGQWYGQIASANATADKEVFIGTFGNNAAIAAHNNALTAWAPLFVNTINANSSGDSGNVYMGGNVGIGTSTPAAKLEVNGNVKWGSTGSMLKTDQGGSIEIRGSGTQYIDFTNDQTEDYDARLMLADDGTLQIMGAKLRAEEIVVQLGQGSNFTAWADYVFEDDYKLMPLTDLAQYVDEHDHLPNMPTSEDVAASGVSLGDTQAKLLEKVEELTLYTIEQQKQIDELRSMVESLQK